ncbi:hypothetical protein MRY87_07635 [bacterium]|nr:hypothetical protein [bacterium]
MKIIPSPPQNLSHLASFFGVPFPSTSVEASNFHRHLAYGLAKGSCFETTSDEPGSSKTPRGALLLAHDLFGRERILTAKAHASSEDSQLLLLQELLTFAVDRTSPAKLFIKGETGNENLIRVAEQCGFVRCGEIQLSGESSPSPLYSS